MPFWRGSRQKEETDPSAYWLVLTAARSWEGEVIDVPKRDNGRCGDGGRLDLEIDVSPDSRHHRRRHGGGGALGQGATGLCARPSAALGRGPGHGAGEHREGG